MDAVFEFAHGLLGFSVVCVLLECVVMLVICVWEGVLDLRVCVGFGLYFGGDMIWFETCWFVVLNAVFWFVVVLVVLRCLGFVRFVI